MMKPIGRAAVIVVFALALLFLADRVLQPVPVAAGTAVLLLLLPLSWPPLLFPSNETGDRSVIRQPLRLRSAEV